MHPAGGPVACARRVWPTLALSLIFLAVPLASAMPGAIATEAAVPWPADGPVGDGAHEARATDPQDVQAWLRTTPVAEVEAALIAWDRAEGGHEAPRPDTLGDYDGFSDEVRRVAWQAWFLRALLDERHDGRSGPSLVTSAVAPSDAALETPAATGVTDEDAAAQAEGEEETDRPAELAARGMRGVWTLEEHGYPREVLPADGSGATFLVTSRAVIRFDAPGEPASWMVKPGHLRAVETTDADGDGVLDLVLGTWSYWGDDEDPSIVVVDGVDGEVLFAGLAGEDALYSWTLSDVDGDGVQDIMGVDVRSRMVAYALDGTTIMQEATGDSASEGSCVVLVCVVAYYLADQNEGFADVDGDGVQDHVFIDQARAYLVAFVLGQQVQQALLVAHSGVDGARLWEAPIPRRVGYEYHYIMGGADVDADGSEDVLLARFNFEEVGFGHYAYASGSGYDVYNGQDGTLLFSEGRAHYGTSLAPGVTVGDAVVDDLLVLDLDGDGAEELVRLDASDIRDAFEDEGRDAGEVVFTAIAPGPTPVSDPEERYTFTVTLPATRYTEIRLLQRDADRDGVVELVFFSTTIGQDAAGNFTELSSRLTIAGPDGTDEQAFATALILWDIDPATGQAYGWTLDDRWAPVDDAGRRIGAGMRLVLSSYSLLEHDVDRDGVVDFLLRQSLGVVWVSGRDGRLLGSVARPPTRYVYTVSAEPDAIHVLEQDFLTGRLSFSPIDDTTPRWSYTEDTFERTYFTGFADVTADGRLDLLMTDHDADERVVFDPERGERVWSVPAESSDGHTSLYALDVLPGRDGDELVVSTRSYERQERSYALHLVEEEAARWTYASQFYSHLLAVDDGWLVLVEENEGAVVHVLDGETGVVNATLALPADSGVTSARIVDILPGGTPELAFTYFVFDGEDAQQHAWLHDFVGGEDIARFDLSPPRVERLVWESGAFLIFSSSSYAFIWVRMSAWLGVPVGDWDGDGRTDLSFTEFGYPVVRSSVDGSVIAAGPDEGSVVEAVDLNADGLPEVAVRGDSGQLRIFRADHAVEAGTVTEEGPVRTVQAPAESKVEDDTLFEEEGRMPAPGAALVLLACMVGLFAVRRRR